MHDWETQIIQRTMIRHFIVTSFKHFKKNLSFSLINLFGLATAMAVCLMILLYVYRELSFDRFHADAENICRIAINVDIQGDILYEPFSSAPMGPDLLEAFPEVTNVVRLSGRQEANVWQNDRFTTFNKSHYADSTFFDIFSFELLRGNPSRALAEPYSLVITESTAQMLFPDQDPMGQLVRLDDDRRMYTITGIAADCPPNSHLQFDLLRSFTTLVEHRHQYMNTWDGGISYYTYLVISGETDMDALYEKTEALAYEKVNYQFEGMGIKMSLEFFPITSIRLRSPFSSEMEEANTYWKVWLFSLVALFVLFIAGFNYVNLCIAKSGKRAREIGMRKVLGAHKPALRRQFYLETLFITGLSFLAALLLVEFFMPLFNNMLNTNLHLFSLPWWVFLAAMILFVGFFGLLASLYPAWYMASFQPVRILKGEFWSKPGRFQPRNLLLLTQFIISMALIVCTLVVYLQVNYFQFKDRGFRQENIMAVRAFTQEDAELFRQSMATYPWVERQSIATSFPGGTSYMEGIIPEDADPGFMSHRIWVDHQYANTLELKLKEGRFFERDDGLEETNALVNETLVKRSGWTEPLGKTIDRAGTTYTVIGVLDDYFFQSLHYDVEPLLVNVLGNRPSYMSHPFWILIAYEGVERADVLLTVQKEWNDLFPGNTLSHVFIPELLELQYVTEVSFGKLFLAFTLLAIIIAMLGVLGLSSFAAQQRQKETGIRKVLGASTFGILYRSSAEFLKWVALASIMALPLAYWYMERWLAGFAYSIGFPFWTLAVAMTSMIIIAIMVVASQSLKAARTNPAEVLKTE